MRQKTNKQRIASFWREKRKRLISRLLDENPSWTKKDVIRLANRLSLGPAPKEYQ